MSADFFRKYIDIITEADIGPNSTAGIVKATSSAAVPAAGLSPNTRPTPLPFLVQEKDEDKDEESDEDDDYEDDYEFQKNNRHRHTKIGDDDLRGQNEFSNSALRSLGSF